MNMTIPSPLEGTYHITDVNYFNPDETLITVIKRALDNQQDILIELGGIGELFLLASKGEYYSKLEDEQTFFCSAVNDVEITVLSRDDRRLQSLNSEGRNCDELLWKAAFYSSKGRLLQGCYPVDMVELKYWPNLTRLPHTENTYRIAALLSRHSTTIAFAARLLRLSPEEVYQFYSAAYCCGAAKPINRTPDEPKLEPHRHQTLLSALLKRISDL